MNVQIPHMIMNMIFTHNRRDVSSPILPPPSEAFVRGLCDEQLSEKTEEKILLSTSDFSLSFVTSFPLSFTREYTKLDFPFLVEVPVETFLVLFGTPCYV